MGTKDKPKRRLSVNKATVRRLNDGEMKHAGGAGGENTHGKYSCAVECNCRTGKLCCYAS